ncbi:MAG: phosphomannomutase/phosphoglucomutase [Deltaproteobacteria bacterium]|nr:phosphomannomutase/phosphoglucomutase [Deltaproteobacteria bacterium]
MNPQIFREYDIRGVVGRDLNEELAYMLGRAYASLAKDSSKQNIAIGYDVRHTSEPYAEAVARGLSEEGVDCTIIGRCPSPQLYWTLYNKDFGGGIQITGSHNPPDMNGFKLCLGTHTLSGAQIQDLKTRIGKIGPNTTGQGQIHRKDFTQEYIQDLISKVKPHMGSRKVKVVVDAGNGAAGEAGPQVLRGLGVEVHELFCEPDGDFPNHHPDPTVMENLRELSAKVRATGSDFGIGWDGDGDRIGVVDQNGQVIFGDMLLVIYARSVLADVRGATVIGDVKCSSRLFQEIEKAGGKPLMWKTGHSLIKNKMREIGAELAGEMSGHIFFKHRFYGFDDAIYCAARLAEIVSCSEGPISNLLADLPPAFATPEIRVDCPEELKFQVATTAQTLFPEYKVETLDGVRIDFEHGWGLVRASNTQPILVMRFEADSEERLKAYQDLVTARIEKTLNDLKSK